MMSNWLGLMKTSLQVLLTSPTLKRLLCWLIASQNPSMALNFMFRYPSVMANAFILTPPFNIIMILIWIIIRGSNVTSPLHLPRSLLHPNMFIYKLYQLAFSYFGIILLSIPFCSPYIKECGGILTSRCVTSSFS